MNVRQKILSNLADRVHAVNSAAAIAGTDFNEGLNELKAMRQDGLLEVTELIRGGGFDVYRLSYQGRQAARGPHLVVDGGKRVG